MRQTGPEKRTLFWVGIAVLTALASAAPAQADSWSEQKCRLYEDAWSAVKRSQPLHGVSRRFLDEHAAFLASGCNAQRQVCPASEAERALSDQLTLMAVSEGMTGTFLPFACRNDLQ